MGGPTAKSCCLSQQLSCESEAHILDGVGICKKVCSSEGQICGGLFRDPKVCCQGFKCVVPNTGTIYLWFKNN
jgi:hypothetical protein